MANLTIFFILQYIPLFRSISSASGSTPILTSISNFLTPWIKFRMLEKVGYKTFPVTMSLTIGWEGELVYNIIGKVIFSFFLFCGAIVIWTLPLQKTFVDLEKWTVQILYGYSIFRITNFLKPTFLNWNAQEFVSFFEILFKDITRDERYLTIGDRKSVV